MSDNTKIKAWYVEDKCDYEGNATVIFAKTRGKAKSIAFYTNACMESSFMDMKATRCPKADKMYTVGKKEMDWNNEKDRLFLINECGFHCFAASITYCGHCTLKEECGFYKDLKKDANLNKREQV